MEVRVRFKKRACGRGSLRQGAPTCAGPESAFDAGGQGIQIGAFVPMVIVQFEKVWWEIVCRN